MATHVRILEKIDRNDLALEAAESLVEIPTPDDELSDLADEMSWEDWGADR